MLNSLSTISKGEKTPILLAIDDKPENLFILQQLIEEYLPDCKIEISTSAKEAYEIVSRTSFDGILVDVQMPEVNGIEFCRKIKSDKNTAHIPVILITAHKTNPVLKAEGLKAGADDFISKPLDNIELVAKIKVMLRMKKYEDDLKDINKNLEEMVRERTTELTKSNEQLKEEITEHKKADAALRESKEELSQIYDSVGDILFYLGVEPDDCFRFLSINQMFLKTTGLTEDQIVGKRIEEVIPEPSIFMVRDNYLKAIKENRIIRWEETTVYSTGNKVGIVSITPVLNEEGICTRLVGSVHDITELKQLEEERTKASKLESIGILAGGIAHDFNNILAVILGNTSLAKMSLNNISEAEELLSEVEKASLRAKDLTQQLLTFSKGGAPIKEIANVTEIIKDTVKFSLRGSNVEDHFSIALNLWLADFDKGQISQAIGNLVINAQQAMPEGGTINVKVDNTTITSKDNLPLKDGNYIKISIEDKGHGIPSEQLIKIFDPYFTTKQLGSGLGLATTYSIIHRHNGHVAVESELGVGSTFHIYLPASSEKIELKDAVKEETTIMTGKILVMDDDEMVRNFVLKVLKSFGNEGDEVSNGAEAIEKYKKAIDSGNPFDVVIMDLTIPGGMGGKKTIKKLLEIDPDAKVIVSTGYADDPVVSNYLDYGFKDKLSKPYKLEELKKVLNDVLSGENK